MNAKTIEDITRIINNYSERFPDELVLGLEDGIADGRDPLDIICEVERLFDEDFGKIDTSLLEVSLLVLQEYEDAMLDDDAPGIARGYENLLQCVEMIRDEAPECLKG